MMQKEKPMEKYLLRSITFRPHWLINHVLPSLHFRPSSAGSKHDIEAEVFRLSHSQNDPFGLLSAYKDPEFLAKASLSANLGSTTPQTSTPTTGTTRSHTTCHRNHQNRLRRFYECQNLTVERLLRTVPEHSEMARRATATEATRVKMAIYGSLVANILLSGVQVFAAVSSGSLSLITTMADAVFDPLSNVILIASNRAVRHVDPRVFPAGKGRLETVGNIVFCFLMMAVSSIIIAFSVRDLVERSRGGGGEVNGFHLPAVIAAATSFATKMGLFMYCFTLRGRYSQVRIVWQDHRNDLFINGLGILTSVGGSKIAWWIDPAGAVVLSLGVIVLWFRTAAAEFMLVVGVAASPEMHQLVTYIALTHSEKVLGIDTVRAYYSGPRLVVEVDVVLDAKTELGVAHDVTEGLQYKLESLPCVERAYVHADYETRHKPEHSYVKTL